VRIESLVQKKFFMKGAGKPIPYSHLRVLPHRHARASETGLTCIAEFCSGSRIEEVDDSIGYP